MPRGRRDVAHQPPGRDEHDVREHRGEQRIQRDGDGERTAGLPQQPDHRAVVGLVAREDPPERSEPHGEIITDRRPSACVA